MANVSKRTQLTTRGYNAVTDDDFTPESIQKTLERLYDDAFAAGVKSGNGEPVRLTKAALSGAWYVIRGAEHGPGSTVTATWKAPIENSADLDRWRDDSGWLTAVLNASGKTDLLGLEVRPQETDRESHRQLIERQREY